jgi:hypothetical protein
MNGHLYFHSPCFDGIASAVLMRDFLVANGWQDIALKAVNYDLKGSWLSNVLPQPCAVVDFLYHPSAEYWADHHGTSFLTKEVEGDFIARAGCQFLVYESAAKSCAGLLWRQLDEKLGHRSPRFADLVRWAEKIDSAGYDSVEEVFEASTPALRINASLSVVEDPSQYCIDLVQMLDRSSLTEVAALPIVSTLADESRARQERGLEVFRSNSQLTSDGVVIYDLPESGTSINRYSAYYVYPDARYSIGIVRYAKGAKITTMRSPWKDFECAPLGLLCEHLGGGGHRRVGSIVLSADRAFDARSMIEKLLYDIRAFHGGNIP